MNDDELFNKRLFNYLVGGVSALLLTVCAFGLVMDKIVSGTVAVIIVLCLAAIQAVVQLYLFLHLGEEKKPRWRSFSFLFTAVTIFIIVGGSVWVVSRMNYHMMMTPEQMSKYMQERSKEGF